VKLLMCSRDDRPLVDSEPGTDDDVAAMAGYPTLRMMPAGTSPGRSANLVNVRVKRRARP
jgi:hypothetical protein